MWVQPLYTAQDTVPGPGPGQPGFAPFVRGSRVPGPVVAGWDVRQQHAHPDPRRANDAVLADLENGVTSLWLMVGRSGLPVAALPDVLNGVYLDLAGVVLDAGAEFAAAAEQLFALWTEGPAAIPAHEATGNLGADPLGLLARTGTDADTAEQLTAAADLAGRCARDFPGVRALTVDALPYHDAGASAEQELGLALSTALAYLRQLTDAGLTAEPGGRAAGVPLRGRRRPVPDHRQAARRPPPVVPRRRGLRRRSRRCGPAPARGDLGRDDDRARPVGEHAAHHDRGPERRASAAPTRSPCCPSTARSACRTQFARRIARNTQAILHDESSLARVIDPAGGSWYVEQLTDQLARGAWDWFQQIERAGGQQAALGSGLIAGAIAQNWAERSADLAHRREPITGVSEFPNLGERPVVRDPAPTPPSGGLPRVRRAEAFEALRARSDSILAATGARPAMLLATLGPRAVHTARSSFAANLFQAGGIETPISEAAGGSKTEQPDVQALAEAFTSSGAQAACICSSDALYAEYGEAAAAALKRAGARYVVLAGRPGDRLEAYQRAGVDDFVYLGCDAVAALTAALDEGGES